MATAEPPQETPPDEVQQIAVQLRPPDEIPQGVPRVYANFAQVTAGQHDAAIRFGWYAIPPFSKPPAEGVLDVPVEWNTVVTIPRGLLPSLVEILQGQIRIATRAEEEGGPGSVGVARGSEAQ